MHDPGGRGARPQHLASAGDRAVELWIARDLDATMPTSHERSVPASGHTCPWRHCLAPVGTCHSGGAVATSPPACWVEISDERGHTLEMLSLPLEALRHVQTPGEQARL